MKNLAKRAWNRLSGKTAQQHFVARKTLEAELVELEQRLNSLMRDNDDLRSQLAMPSVGTGLPTYVDFSPDLLNSLRLFPGSWSSRLPGVDGPGSADLFEDERIEWLIKECSGVKGWEILELGSLEGGHAYMLEAAGANLTSIEANTQAFLRTLIVKNFLNLRGHFLLGDFTKSLGPVKKWDLIVASGVLYHMMEPGKLLERLSLATNRLFLWTHYFEPDISLWSANWRDKLESKWHRSDEFIRNIAGVDARHVPYSYNEALGWSGFCGGPNVQSCWLYKDDIHQIIRNLGFQSISYSFEEPNHPNGPAFCLLATR